MLYLITGLMGASKTLNAIKFIHEEKQFQGRPVYYFRIRNLNDEMFPAWTEIQKEDIEKWRDYPDGSVFLIDECDHAFPQRSAKQEVPEYIRELKETRTRGMDWVFVTQHPSQMDVFVRRNIGHHIHIERLFGTERSKWYEWGKYVDPEDRRNRSAAKTKIVKFDKKYYNAYKSAEYHTHAKTIPYKYLILPVVFLIAAFAFAGFKFLGWGADDSVQQFSPVDSVVDASRSSASFLTPTPRQSEPLTAEQYIADRTPRIADIPWSAPVYDDVYKVESYPRPQCFVWESGRRKGECNCVTQQATPLTISHETCLAIVRQGYFQEFVQDRAIQDNQDFSQGSGYQLQQTSDSPGTVYTLSAPAGGTPNYQPPRSYNTGLATRF